MQCTLPILFPTHTDIISIAKEDSTTTGKEETLKEHDLNITHYALRTTIESDIYHYCIDQRSAKQLNIYLYINFIMTSSC